LACNLGVVAKLSFNYLTFKTLHIDFNEELVARDII